MTRTQEWACRPEGLVALQLGGPSAATLNTQNMQLNLSVNNVSGVTFPSEIATGKEWQHMLEFEGDLDIAGTSAEATGAAESNFSALGTESVTVPAGTFDTMKIQVDSTITINASFQGVSMPIAFSGKYIFWFAQGVGSVKASGAGEIAGKSFTETMELQSYNIP
ncbi:MAG: TapB family protein [Anaerolineales bacterium]